MAEKEKPQVNPEKLKVLSAVMDKIEKDFGKGAIMKMSDRAVDKVPVIPSGSVTIDHALGIGGYPKGRIIEIFGPESSGKTTLAIHAIAEAQKAGGIAAFIDAEHAFDSTYAQKLGVDIDDLLISQPDNGEQALEIADRSIAHSIRETVEGTPSLRERYRRACELQKKIDERKAAGRKIPAAWISNPFHLKYYGDAGKLE